MTAGADAVLAEYEERTIGWRKRFELHADRLEIAYRRFLGNRGQVSVPLSRLTDMVEHAWVKYHTLHMLIFYLSAPSGLGLFLAAMFWAPMAPVRAVAPYVLCGSVLAPLLLMVFDPPRVDYLRAYMAQGSFVSIGAVRSKISERDAFYQALMAQAGQAGIPTRGDGQADLPRPAVGERGPDG